MHPPPLSTRNMSVFPGQTGKHSWIKCISSLFWLSIHFIGIAELPVLFQVCQALARTGSLRLFSGDFRNEDIAALFLVGKCGAKYLRLAEGSCWTSHQCFLEATSEPLLDDRVAYSDTKCSYAMRRSCCTQSVGVCIHVCSQNVLVLPLELPDSLLFQQTCCITIVCFIVIVVSELYYHLFFRCHFYFFSLSWVFHTTTHRRSCIFSLLAVGVS